MKKMLRPGSPLSSTLPELTETPSLRAHEGRALLKAIALSAQEIARLLRQGGGQVSASTVPAGVNISGDLQKPIDLFAHELIRDTLLKSGVVYAIGSEESEDLLYGEKGRFVILYDPLDGSSNVDIQIPTGTIFSIYPADAFESEKLPPCKVQIGAGYILYSATTVLVLSLGKGVHSFFLDPDRNEFLFVETIQIPERGEIYSINEANAPKWEPPRVRSLIERFKGKENPAGKPYTLRYVGTLVADAHRTLKKGGIFIYPGDQKNRRGKLRLLYECAPMAFLFEQAGGRATDGEKRILDLTPESLHEKTPLFLGSPQEFALYEEIEG
jgi:fructose-1,6-bisphosphatase I